MKFKRTQLSLPISSLPKFLLSLLFCLSLLATSMNVINAADGKRVVKPLPKNGYEYVAPSHSTRRIYGETRRPIYYPQYNNHYSSRYPYSNYFPTHSVHYQNYTPYSYGSSSLSVNWGSGGLTIGRFTPSIYPGQFIPYQNSGYSNYRAYPNHTQLDMYGRPLWTGGRHPFDNNVLHNAQRENDIRWNGPLDQLEQQRKIDQQLMPNPITKPFIASSSPAKLKSIRAQAEGDVWFRKQQYSRAYARYKKAVNYAEDQPRAQFRLAYSMVAMGRFEKAVKTFKRGLYVDPTWVTKGESLEKVFGKNNQLAKGAMISKVTDWTRQDIRDPDRLFLMGLLLYYDHDDRAGKFFETAYRLAGSGSHLLAFLNSKNTATPQQSIGKPINTIATPQVGPIQLPGAKPDGQKPEMKGLPPLPANDNSLPPLPSKKQKQQVDANQLFGE